MKYFLFLTILLLIDRSFSFQTEFEFENRIKMSSEFKMKSRTFLQKLDSTVNFHLKFKNIQNVHPRNSQAHSSSPPNLKVNYIQYQYKEYQEIVDILKGLSVKYPNLIKLETAQNLYNLPNPGGECAGNGQACLHWIVTLTNHLKDSKNKPQVKYH